jgi:hypothetical protein
VEFVNYAVLKDYGRNMAAARRHYRAYVEACVMEDDRPLREAMAGSRYAIGGAEFVDRREERIEQRRSGRVQDQDLDLPRRTVSLAEIDGAVARHFRIESGLFSAHGRRAGIGRAKSVAVELAAQLADLTGRAIGEHYGICAAAVGANRRRLATRPEILQVIEMLGKKLRRQKVK